MKWLLDTNAVSELSKPAPAEELVNWLAANESDAALSAVTIGEIVGGVERLPEGKSGAG